MFLFPLVQTFCLRHDRTTLSPQRTLHRQETIAVPHVLIYEPITFLKRGGKLALGRHVLTVWWGRRFAAERAGAVSAARRFTAARHRARGPELVPSSLVARNQMLTCGRKLRAAGTPVSSVKPPTMHRRRRSCFHEHHQRRLTPARVSSQPTKRASLISEPRSWARRIDLR